MKKILGLICAVSLISWTLIITEQGSSSIAIGTEAPEADYKMKDVSGKMMSLNDLKGSKGLLVIFSCNTCPFVVGGEGLGEGWQDRYNGIQEVCNSNTVGMVLVNSNEGKRSGDDSYENMVKHAKEQAYISNYVLDKDSKLANAFGAKTTPHVFLFDKDLKLVYKGAIDDSNKSADEVKEHWLKNALNALGSGNTIDPSETRNKGCSIKRVKK